MKVSIIIPNYNGSVLLKENLPKILANAETSEVIVVDDASTDDSVTLLETHFPKVKVIVRKTNEGFASSVNEGVKVACGNLILLLNSDVVPEKNFLQHLLVHFKDPQVFAVGCLQKISDQNGISKQGRGVGRFKKGFLVHGPGEPDKTDTLWVFGGAGMYRKDLWEKLGGIDTIYNPFYWEDIDLSYRALKAGYKLVFESRSIVIHNQEKGAIRNLYTPQQIKTIAYRNQILFVWLNITDLQFILTHLIWLPYYLFKSLVTGNLVFVKALLMVILKSPYILRKRWASKKLAVLSDNEILQKF